MKLIPRWPQPKREKDVFLSGCYSIGLDVFRPTARGKFPALLFLHGANGLHPLYDLFAQCLAQHGYVTFVPHFFDRTGTVEAWSDSEIARDHFLSWLRTSEDALSLIHSDAGVDSNRVGLVGVSLGATMALALAPNRGDIQAVAELWGEMPGFLALQVQSMPPTFVVHGGLDTRLPVEDVVNWISLLNQRITQCEVRIYPMEDHVFKPLASQDAIWQTIGFLDKWL